MPTVGFEPKISADQRPQNYALERAASVTGFHKIRGVNFSVAKIVE